MSRLDTRFVAVAHARADSKDPVVWDRRGTAASAAADGAGGWRGTTFKELDQWSNQIARELLSCGAVRAFRGDRVCVRLARSAEMAAALLGISKTGSLYVPLDPAYPTAYTELVLAACKPQAVVTSSACAGQLRGWAATKAIDLHVLVTVLDEPEGSQGACSWQSLEAGSLDIELDTQQEDGSDMGDPDNCYVLFTSGSTGLPKGVVGRHSAALSRIGWMHDTYPFSEGEVMCQKTSLNFVDSVWEVFGPLLAPAVHVPVVMVQNAKHVDALVLDLAACKVSRLTVVPSLLRVLLEAFPDLALQLPRLKLWICSGEPLSVSLLANFRRRFPAATLLNLYGSTEVSGDCTCAQLGPVEEGGSNRTTLLLEESSTASIGKPIGETVCLVEPLDPAPGGQAAEHPVTGELLVGGPLLARGYFERPEETGARFVERVLPQDGTTSRFYKTGDLVRQDTPGGEFWFLGRVDNQVKIRGVRVELEAVERALLGTDGVAEVACAAAALGNDEEQKSLVAFVVLKQLVAGSSGAFKALAEEVLPEGAVPSVFQVVDKIQQSPNGKIDRKAMVVSLRAQRKALSIESSGAEEGTTWACILQAVRETFGELLLTSSLLNRASEFYALGGHSLLLVQVTSALAKATGVRVRLGACPPAGKLQLGWFEQYIDACKVSAAEPELLQAAGALLEDSTIQICEFTLEFVEQVVPLFVETFVSLEPLSVALKLNPELVFDFAGAWIWSIGQVATEQGLDKALSFVGLCRGRVVAFTLNERKTFEEEEEPELPPAMMPVFAWSAVLEEAYFEELGVPPANVVSMMFSGARRPSAAGDEGACKFDGANLCQRLDQVALARFASLGYQLAYTSCTNHVTAVVAEELGFQKVLERSTWDFEFDGEYVFKDIPEVHRSTALYDKRL